MDLAQLVEFTRWMAIILTGISLTVFIKYIYDNIARQVEPYPSGQGTTARQQAIMISGIGDQPKKIEELTQDELKRLLNMIESAGDVEEGNQVDN